MDIKAENESHTFSAVYVHWRTQLHTCQDTEVTTCLETENAQTDHGWCWCWWCWIWFWTFQGISFWLRFTHALKYASSVHSTYTSTHTYVQHARTYACTYARTYIPTQRCGYIHTHASSHTLRQTCAHARAFLLWGKSGERAMRVPWCCEWTVVDSISLTSPYSHRTITVVPLYSCRTLSITIGPTWNTTLISYACTSYISYVVPGVYLL